MREVIRYLKEKKLTIALAESMTGGELSASFTKKSGASKVFVGSIVAYNKAVKTNLLNVPIELIQKYSIVSNEVSISMVSGLKNLINADVYVSITGNAGPTLEPDTTEFLAYITIFYKNEFYSGTVIFDNNRRKENIDEAILVIKEMILNYI